MRAAQIEYGVVINFAEVNGFDGHQLIDPLDSVLGSTWDGEKFVNPISPLPTEAEYVKAVQAVLDGKARERHYDGILSACTYATSTNSKFQKEGQACVSWRDAVWAKCYDLLAQVKSGALAQPTLADLLAMLPALDWPA
jgi:hypothetical protein